MRNDPVIPKATIGLVVVTPLPGEEQVQVYRVVTWADESADRKLVGYYETFQDAKPRGPL